MGSYPEAPSYAPGVSVFSHPSEIALILPPDIQFVACKILYQHTQSFRDDKKLTKQPIRRGTLKMFDGPMLASLVPFYGDPDGDDDNNTILIQTHCGRDD